MTYYAFNNILLNKNNFSAMGMGIIQNIFDQFEQQ